MSLKHIVRFAFAFAVIGIGQSGIIDILHKCPIKDAECLRQLFQDMLHEIGENGMPESGIPSLNPIHVKDIYVSVLNLVNITFVDGIVKGIKDCTFEEFTLDFEKSIGRENLLCDILIKGNYKLSGASPVIESMLGGSDLHGEGKTKIKIEKLRIEFIFPFTLKRREDGEIYLYSKFEEIQRDFDVLGKVNFAADKIFFGEQDVSKMIVNTLNENWKFVMKSFGQPFIDKAAEICYDLGGRLFDTISMNNYISEDLTPYLTD